MIIGIGLFVLFTLLPLLDSKRRTKVEVIKAVITLIAAAALVLGVLFFQLSYVLGVLLLILLTILIDKNTYTRKMLLIYGSLLVVIVGGLYWIFRDNPEYVANHLQKHPQSSSLFVAKAGEPIIEYNVDSVRPLASTVKIVVALEYAFQVEEGRINQEQLVSMEELDRLYIPGTDGGAHEKWKAQLSNKKEVTLHEVAEGMIKYSSGANTDYLMILLTIDAINERIESLGIHPHEPVYPIVGAFVIGLYLQQENLVEDDLENELKKLPLEEYRILATNLSKEMLLEGTSYGDISNLSLKVQRVWSDHLIGSSASAYGKLLAAISRDEYPERVSSIMRDLLEWPLEYESNKERFTHIGAKGGSTAFVLNQAMYIQTKEGERIEIVLLMDDLNWWNRLLLTNNIDSFLMDIIEGNKIDL